MSEWVSVHSLTLVATPPPFSALRPPPRRLGVATVETPDLAPAQQAALTALLDDPSPAVHQALLAEFTRVGPAAIRFLHALAHDPASPLAVPAATYLRELAITDPVGEFLTFIRSLNYELETGALLLSRTINADLDVGACCTQLDTLAARCRELIAEPATTREKCRVLNRVLFHEYGLHGNAEHYTDPLNSYLDQVLIRRQGIPISLSIVYLLVAERMDLPLEPVGLPGHFLVGCYDEAAPFFIDPFHAGRLLSAPEALALVPLRPGQTEPSVMELAPTPVSEVLCRCCRNLVSHYTAAQDPARARLFASFVAEFAATHARHASS